MKKLCFAIFCLFAAACTDPEFLQSESKLSQAAKNLSVYREDAQLFSCPYPYTHVPMTIELGDSYGIAMNPNPGYCEKIYPANTYYIMVSGGAAAYCFEITGATLANGGGTTTCKDATGGQISVQIISNTPVNTISAYVTPTDDCGIPQTAYRKFFRYRNPICNPI